MRIYTQASLTLDFSGPFIYTKGDGNVLLLRQWRSDGICGWGSRIRVGAAALRFTRADAGNRGKAEEEVGCGTF